MIVYGRLFVVSVELLDLFYFTFVSSSSSAAADHYGRVGGVFCLVTKCLHNTHTHRTNWVRRITERDRGRVGIKSPEHRPPGSHKINYT